MLRKLNLNTCIGKAWGLIDDDDGATFWPTNAGACFDANNARFRVAGVDLAALYASAGNDYMLWAKDIAGKIAKGYIDLADDAEALGSDLFDAGAGIFTAGTYSWVAQGTNTIANDNNTLKITWVDDQYGAKLLLNDAADLSSDLTIGKLYKLTFDCKVDTGNTILVQLFHGLSTITMATETNDTMQSHTTYFIAQHATTCYIRMRGMGTGDIIWLDNIVLEEVTHVGEDGVLIHDAKGSATQSWTLQESGIDLNGIATFEVLIAK